MEETTEKCPICLEDFNTDDPDKTPYRTCEHGHFGCKDCIESLIGSNYTNHSNVSITTNISDSSIKLVCQYDEIAENSLPPCSKCSMCRNPIKYDFKKLRRNNQSWGVENTFTFHRDRYFEEKINNPPIDTTSRERVYKKKIEELRLMNKKKEETNIQNKKVIEYLKSAIGLLNYNGREKLKVDIHDFDSNPAVEIKDSSGTIILIVSNPPYRGNEIVQSLMGRGLRN